MYEIYFKMSGEQHIGTLVFYPSVDYGVKPRNKRKQYLLRIRNTAPSRHSPTTIPSTTPMIIANTKSEKNILISLFSWFYYTDRDGR